MSLTTCGAGLAVDLLPPVNTILPAITGTAIQGQVLSCSTGTWTNSPASYTYQWVNSATGNIVGATSSTYTIQASDVGDTLTCRVTAHTATAAASATSLPTATVVADLPSSLTGLQLWDVASKGLSTDGAVSFVGASSQRLSIASNSSLQSGAYSMTVAGWFNVSSGFAGDIVAKNDEGSNREWIVRFGTGGGGTIGFYFWKSDGSTFWNANVGSVTSGVNHFFVAWFDIVAQTINLQVDGGSVASVAVATPSGGHPTSTAFTVGSSNATGTYFTGSISQIDFWNGVVVPGTSQTALYNSGAGLPFESWTSALRTGLTSVWQFRQPGNIGLDSVGTNTLTPNNAPTYVAGNITGTPSLTGDAVSKIADQSTNADNSTQTTGANRYTLQLAQVNGQPAVKSQGITGLYSLGSSIPLSGTFTLYCVAYRTVNTTLVFVGGATGAAIGYEHASNVSYGRNNSSQIGPASGTAVSGAFAAYRIRRDASGIWYIACSGRAEVTIGTLTGTTTLNDLFFGPGGSGSGSGNQVSELFLTNTDAVTNGQDATIARPYISTTYGLTIP